VQVGGYACYFDLKLTIYSGGLPTGFHYLLALDFPLLFIIIISSFPLQQIMAPLTPQQDEHGTKSSRTRGASSNMHPVETQLQHRLHLAHRDAANTPTESLTLYTQLEIGWKIGSGRNKMQHGIGCEYSRIAVDNG